ncbi:alpha/beta fold hydrolase [Hyalangium rubrum]|uniref:Alpha/beta hydrolase n=1 Tax=Hyalangium rubrum TaxID=3103134 RepID=A0ABU5H6G1_9BACT|nr:alpha/beta hydrolase [Hyalangium sp. s54d21]MDY7228930.1 alpha/beta hydrolase [Hyalangium sp. s54d21]
MPEVRSKGASIHYEEMGREEPALLLVPGWCCSRAVFGSLSTRLSPRHRVLSMDLRGHGQSDAGSRDFTSDTLVEDLLAVVEASAARQVVPVALSHAGWFAIELRRRLGQRVPGLVLLDWIVLEPPPPFLAALTGLQSESWRQSRDALFGMWLQGVDSEDIFRFVREDMGSFSGEMWQRAAREIASGYNRDGYPLRALSALTPPVPTLHVYAQPEDPAYLMAQQSFAAEHPWFHVARLNARSHFPALEVPAEVAEHIERFLALIDRSASRDTQGPSAPTEAGA